MLRPATKPSLCVGLPLPGNNYQPLKSRALSRSFAAAHGAVYPRPLRQISAWPTPQFAARSLASRRLGFIPVAVRGQDRRRFCTHASIKTFIAALRLFYNRQFGPSEIWRTDGDAAPAQLSTVAWPTRRRAAGFTTVGLRRYRSECCLRGWEGGIAGCCLPLLDVVDEALLSGVTVFRVQSVQLKQSDAATVRATIGDYYRRMSAPLVVLLHVRGLSIACLSK